MFKQQLMMTIGDIVCTAFLIFGIVEIIYYIISKIKRGKK